MSKPSRIGPWIAIALSAYGTVLWFVHIFIDGLPAIAIFLFSLSCLGVSCWWMGHTLAALERWKAERELNWWMQDRPEED